MSVIYMHDLIDELIELSKSPTSRKGVSTGFPDLDELMMMCKGLLAVTTGYPGSGKSEFVDQLTFNLGMLHGWRSLYFSPENYPIAEHARKHVERYTRKPIHRIKSDELREAITWFQDLMGFIQIEDDKFGIDTLLKIAEEEMARRKFDVLIFDPWNECDDFTGQREDLHISQAISKFKRFLRKHDVLGIIVAHPKTPTEKVKDHKGRMDYPIPKMYSISGGAMWRNKADYAWIVHRYPGENEMMLQVQKVKFKSLGKIGELNFHYEFMSGRFKTEMQSDWSLPQLPLELPL